MRSQRFQGDKFGLYPLSGQRVTQVLARLAGRSHGATTRNPNILNMNVNAWIIALNPENPVALELQRTLREQGIDATVRDAVDGRKEMPQLQGREQLSQRKAMVYRRAELTTAEVGCYLSHYRLIREAYKTGLSHICIFEDDVVAEPGIGDLIRDITHLDEKAHLVRLMSLKICKRKIVQQLASGYTLVRPMRGALGGQGYVLNRTGMKKILDFGATIYMPIDKLYDSFFLFGLNCFSVEPHAVYELVRPTSVKKAFNSLDDKPLAMLRWRISKLLRSAKRRIHYWRHVLDFTPASKPEKNLGKSQRIR